MSARYSSERVVQDDNVTIQRVAVLVDEDA
jgi:hypothetical protein